MWAAGETRKAWKALDHQLLRCDPTAKRKRTMSMTRMTRMTQVRPRVRPPVPNLRVRAVLLP